VVVKNTNLIDLIVKRVVPTLEMKLEAMDIVEVDYAGKDWLLINNDGSGVVADGNWDENAIEDLEAELEYQQESDD
jgi:hypothetical protein